MGIWFLTARRRWSIRSMAMSNGAAARGNMTRQRQLTLIGLLTAITFDDAGAADRFVQWICRKRNDARLGAGDHARWRVISMRHGVWTCCGWVLPQPRSGEKRWRTTAVQNAGACTKTPEIREASWSAPALWRFGRSAGKTGDEWKC